MRLSLLAALAQRVLLAAAMKQMVSTACSAWNDGLCVDRTPSLVWYPGFDVGQIVNDSADGCRPRNITGVKMLCLDRTIGRAHFILDGQGDKDRHCMVAQTVPTISEGDCSDPTGPKCAWSTIWNETACTW